LKLTSLDSEMDAGPHETNADFIGPQSAKIPGLKVRQNLHKTLAVATIWGYSGLAVNVLKNE